MACNSNVNEPVAETKSLKKAIESLDFTFSQMPIFGTNDVVYLVSFETNLNIQYILVNGVNKDNNNPFVTELESFEIFIQFTNGDVYNGYVTYSPPSDPPLDPIL
jgi:hypothetical protein